jgi:hypothetical protein
MKVGGGSRVCGRSGFRGSTVLAFLGDGRRRGGKSEVILFESLLCLLAELDDDLPLLFFSFLLVVVAACCSPPAFLSRPLDLGMPVVRGDGRRSGSCCRARRRKSYREVLDSGLSSEANRVRLVVGG